MHSKKRTCSDAYQIQKSRHQKFKAIPLDTFGDMRFAFSAGHPEALKAQNKPLAAHRDWLSEYTHCKCAIAHLH